MTSATGQVLRSHRFGLRSRWQILRAVVTMMALAACRGRASNDVGAGAPVSMTADPSPSIVDGVRPGWRAMSSVGAPRFSRMGPNVWTGTELIVFGFAREDDLDHTWAAPAAYDPRTDRWRDCSLDGAPRDEMFTFAQWLDAVRQVLVCDQNGAWCARYDPRTDRWRQSAPPPPPPDGRDWLSGFALGAIGFHAHRGGMTSFTYAADVPPPRELEVVSHLYDPATDTWALASSPASADVPRVTSWAPLHSAAPVIGMWGRGFALDTSARAWRRTPDHISTWTASLDDTVHLSAVVTDARLSGVIRAEAMVVSVLHLDAPPEALCIDLTSSGPFRGPTLRYPVKVASMGECALLYVTPGWDERRPSDARPRGQVCCPSRSGITCERIDSPMEPSPRFGYVSAWTGRDFIVWGGSAQRDAACDHGLCAMTRLTDGALYRPPSAHRGVAPVRCDAGSP